MIDQRALRQVREEAERVLSDLTEKALPSRFRFSDEMPRTLGQYWEYELSLWEDDDTWHNLRCGCFTGKGSCRNRDAGVNAFFQNNDRVLDEFISAVEAGALDELIPVLARAEGLLPSGALSQSVAGAALNLHSYVLAADDAVFLNCQQKNVVRSKGLRINNLHI